jgi:hypothetical protein
MSNEAIAAVWPKHYAGRPQPRDEPLTVNRNGLELDSRKHFPLFKDNLINLIKISCKYNSALFYNWINSGNIYVRDPLTIIQVYAKFTALTARVIEEETPSVFAKNTLGHVQRNKFAIHLKKIYLRPFTATHEPPVNGNSSSLPPGGVCSTTRNTLWKISRFFSWKIHHIFGLMEISHVLTWKFSIKRGAAERLQETCQYPRFSNSSPTRYWI